MRPVCSSTMSTSPSITTYSLSLWKSSLALIELCMKEISGVLTDS